MELIRSLLEMHAKSGEYEVTIKDVDSFQPEGEHVDPFDITVVYTTEDGGSDVYPIGDRNEYVKHGKIINVVRAFAASEVVVRDPETEDVIKRLPVGTPVEEIPGYYPEIDDWFQSEAEEDFDRFGE